MSDSDAQRPAGDDESAFHLEVTSLDGGQPITRRPRRRWLRAAQGGAAFVVLVGLLYAFVLPHGAPSASTVTIISGGHPNKPIPTLVTYTGQALTCPISAAWSPKSDQFAVVDYLACSATSPLGGPVGGALAIFQARASLPPSVISLDPIVRQYGLPAGMATNAQEMNELRITYGPVDWSPDGRTIAVSYDTATITPAQEGSGLAISTLEEGLILISAADPTSTPRVLHQPQSGISIIVSTPGAVPANPLSVWNLKTGGLETFGVPAALSFTWGPSDSLQPKDFLGAAPAPTAPYSTAPVGNPDGGATFALWQDGTATLFTENCGPDGGGGNGSATPTAGQEPYVSLALQPAQPIWSPDGVVLVAGTMSGINVQGRANVPISRTELASAPALCDSGAPEQSTPGIPIRDAGLWSALTHLSAGQAALAWRPDGQRLVTYTSGSAADTLTMYDCATGKQLVKLSRLDPRQGLIFGEPTLFWSPDSRHLLVLSGGSHAITVLDASQLGG